METQRRLHLRPREGFLVGAVLGLLHIEVISEGTVAPDAAVILAGKPHTTHLDTLVIHRAASDQGRENIFPVPKGEYWGRGGYNRLLKLLFSGKFYLTKSEQDSFKQKDPSFFDLFLEDIQKKDKQHTVIIFPQGTRNSRSKKIHRGAFVAAARAKIEREANVPVQPVEIQNAPKILMSGDFHAKELAAILYRSLIDTFTDKKTVVTVIFHPALYPENIMESMEIDTVKELSGAMMGMYASEDEAYNTASNQV